MSVSERFRSFYEIIQYDPFSREYSLYVRDLNTPYLILAPHGGSIEPGTSELARAIAGSDFSVYCFEGQRSEDGKRLHITSTRFDEPMALKMAKHARTVIAIHGYSSASRSVVVGGLDDQLKDRFIQSLERVGFKASIGTHGLAGRDAYNICNRGSSGKGVQLEISEAMRRTFFQGLKNADRHVTTPEFYKFISACRYVLLNEPQSPE